MSYGKTRGLSMPRILDFTDGFSQAVAPTTSVTIESSSNQAIAAGGQVTVQNVSFQHLKVSGDGGAQSASTTPFTGTLPDRSIIILQGTDSTNTLTLANNDAAGGCILNGDAVLAEYYILKLIYDSDANRFIELERNFA